MRSETTKKLLDLNREFYQRCADSFSKSRYRVQPGVRRLLPELSKSGSILDVGCGNGNLIKALNKAGYSGSYHGIDFSPALLDYSPTAEQAKFSVVDLSSPTWDQPFEAHSFDAITCFAVLHHLPGKSLQAQVFRQFSRLLKPSAKLILSVWQPLNSERLSKRVLPWQTIGLDPSDLDSPCDLLLDWHAESAQSASPQTPAYRYVHQYTTIELEALAGSAGLCKVAEWLDDGRQGNLALYQIWQLPSEPSKENQIETLMPGSASITSTPCRRHD